MLRSHLRIWLWMNFYGILRWMTAIFFVSVTVTALTFIVYNVGPKIENRLFPVISRFAIEKWHVSDNKLDITPVIEKDRLCLIRHIDAYVTDLGESDKFTRVPVDTNYMTSSPAPRPVGVQRLSDWKMDIPEGAGQGSEFFFIFSYSCHPLWLTQVMTRKFSLPVAGQTLKEGDYVESDKWWD